jgi:hypothetical protein
MDQSWTKIAFLKYQANAGGVNMWINIEKRLLLALPKV